MLRSVRCILLLLALVSLLGMRPTPAGTGPIALLGSPSDPVEATCGKDEWSTISEYSHGPWKLTSFLDPGRELSHLKIAHHGVVVWEFGGLQTQANGTREGTFWVSFHTSNCLPETSGGHPEGAKHWKLPDGSDSELVVEDVSGRGGLSVIAFEWTGGAHAAFNYWVLDLRADGRVTCVNFWPLGNSVLTVSRSAVGEPVVFGALDNTFAYWNCCFASSPFPPIRLTWCRDRWQVANQALSQEEVAALLATGKLRAEAGHYDDWCHTLIHLLWHGHVDASLLLLKLGRSLFADGRESLEQWWDDLRKEAPKSLFWADLVALFPQLSTLPSIR